jgi:hypothetical protein
MAAFDAAQITQAVRELAQRHEALAGRLSRAIGAIPDYHEMTTAQLAAYGLKKLGIQPPDAGDDPSIVALEHYLKGRSGLGGQGGQFSGMDAAADNFVTRYIAST